MPCGYAVLDPPHNFCACSVLVYHRAVSQVRQWASLLAVAHHHKLALVLLHKRIEYVLGTAVATLDTTTLVVDTLAETLDDLYQRELGNTCMFTVHQYTGGYGTANACHPESLIVGSLVFRVHLAHSLKHQRINHLNVVNHVLR